MTPDGSTRCYSGVADSRRWLLTAALREHAERRGHAEWLRDSDGDRLSFAQAHEESLRAASFFHELGVRRGERVGIFAFNGTAFVRAWFGLANLGVTSVLFNTELRGAFLHHQLADSGVRHLVVDVELLPHVAALRSSLERLACVVAVGAGAGALPSLPGVDVVRWPDLGAFAAHAGTDPAPGDIASVMYTSGTSGPSKGVLMPHAHCMLYGVGAARAFGVRDDDKYYVVLPLFHANGLFMQLGTTLVAGIPAYVRRRFSASAWLDDIRREGATVTHTLGAIAPFILAQPSSARDREHRLRGILAAPNLPEHEAAFRTRFGVADVISGFGMTECNVPVWGRVGTSAPGAAGWVHDDHFEISVVDPETDRSLAPGEVGELLVRPKVPFGFMAGYLNAPQKTVEAWRNLWFHTGDAAKIDHDGLVTFIDRLKDCIRRRGENISATQVEDVVAGHEAVAEVAAYAVPSDLQGAEDEVMLAVVPRPGQVIDAHALGRYAAERLPRFARPRYVRVVTQLPKTATGKVQRAVLRQQGALGAQDLGA